MTHHPRSTRQRPVSHLPVGFVRCHKENGIWTMGCLSSPGRGHARSRLRRDRRTLSEVSIKVIVLNGGSSSGKSWIATCLQQQLEETWLTLGVDDLIRALSHGPTDTSAGRSIHFGSEGSIVVGEVFHQAEAAWYQGVAAIAARGIPSSLTRCSSMERDHRHASRLRCKD